MLYVVVREVGDDGAVRRLRNRESDAERKRVKAVDESLSELGLGGELGVEMQRLLVHRRVAEPLVVGF